MFVDMHDDHHDGNVMIIFMITTMISRRPFMMPGMMPHEHDRRHIAWHNVKGRPSDRRMLARMGPRFACLNVRRLPGEL